MSLGYGIDTSTLGLYGLGASPYGSYDMYMPSSMGMSGMYGGMGNSLFGYGMNGMGSMTGMGAMSRMGMGSMMFNPLYYSQIQNQAEELSLQHAGKMHSGMLSNEVTANRDSSNALIAKIINTGELNQGIETLYKKIKDGDQEGVCHEFDKLKNVIFYRYKNELEAMGTQVNPSNVATSIIAGVYSPLATKWAADGKDHNLMDDIQIYGESAITNGILSGSKKGHQQMYVDQTLNHIYGLDINDKESLDEEREHATIVGRVLRGGKVSLKGATAGAGAFAIGTGVYNLANYILDRGVRGVAGKISDASTAETVAKGFSKSRIKFTTGRLAWAAGLGALLFLAKDVLWQATEA